MKLCLASVLALALVVLPVAPAAADPNTLGNIVDKKCVPDQQANGKPAPCAMVDTAKGYAILKDLVGASQFLLIASGPVSGIESPTLEAPGAPSYFEDAWQARHFMADALKRDVPRDVVGLAINSVGGRSQNRLHIHIDCIRADVLQQLKADAGSIEAGKWSELPGGLAGHPYRAMRVDAADLSGLNPFELVSESLPPGDAKMDDQTIVIAATALPQGGEGFYLLTDHAGATPGDRASGEELQDHDCSVLKTATQ